MYKWFCVSKLSLNIAKIIYYLADIPINKMLLSLSIMLLYRKFKPLDFLAS